MHSIPKMPFNLRSFGQYAAVRPHTYAYARSHLLQMEAGKVPEEEKSLGASERTSERASERATIFRPPSSQPKRANFRSWASQHFRLALSRSSRLTSISLRDMRSSNYADPPDM